MLLILNIGKFYLRLFALSETYRCNQFTLSYGDNTARGNLLLFVQHGAIKMTEPGLMKKILILAANPQGTSRLRLDKEVRAIDEGLRRSPYDEPFRIEQRWASRPRDVQRFYVRNRPCFFSAN